MLEKKYTSSVYYIIALSFLIRITIPFFFFKDWLTRDSVTYIAQADELLEGGFGLYFPNGFPSLIAFITLSFGIENREIALIILNILLSTFSLILFWMLLKKNIGVNIFSVTALAIFAFYSNQLNYVRYILTEIPSLFFLLLSVYFLSQKKLSYSGLVLGISILIKTSLLPIMILITAYLFYTKKLRAGTTFIVSSFIPVAIMASYGLIISGTFTLGLSSVHNFYLSVHQPVLLSDSLISAVSYYLNYALSNPLIFITERFNSLWEFWGFLPSANEGLRENLVFRLLIGLRFPLLILAIIGFIKSVKNHLIIFSASAIISITILHTVFYSIPRYNFTVEPFLILLAVIGFKYLVDKPEQSKHYGIGI